MGTNKAVPDRNPPADRPFILDIATNIDTYKTNPQPQAINRPDHLNSAEYKANAPSPAISTILILTGALGSACLFALAPFANPDGWHHLFVGRWIFEHREIPKLDAWTFTAYGLPWIPHEWLFQLAMFVAYHLGGFPTLALMKTALAAIALFFGGLAGRALGAQTAIILPLQLMAGFGASYRFVDRPHMATFALAAATIWILSSWVRDAHISNSVRAAAHSAPRSHRCQLLALVIPVYWIWGNCHAGVAYGWVILGAYFLAAIPMFRSNWPAARCYLVIAPLALLSTVLNPNGPDTLLYSYHTLGRIQGTGNEVLEFQRHFSPASLIRIALAGAMALVWLFLAIQRKVPIYEAAIVLFVSALAILWVREHAFLYLIALPYAAARITELFGIFRRTASARKHAAVVCIGALWIISAMMFANRYPAINGRIGSDADDQPKEAMDFVIKADLPHKVLAVSRFVGYCQWRRPESKVFFDPRFDLLPRPILTDMAKVLQQGGTEFGPILRKHDCEWLLLDYPTAPIKSFDTSTTLTGMAFNHPEWTLVHWDDTAIVYLRRDLAESKYANLRTWKYVNPVVHGRDLLAGSPSLPLAIDELQSHREQQPECVLGLRLLGMALLADNRTTAALDAFSSLLSTTAPQEDDYYNCAYVQDELHMSPQSLATVNEGLERYPNSAKLLDMQGILLASSGRLQEAIRSLEKAAKIGPPDESRDRNLAQMRSQIARSQTP